MTAKIYYFNNRASGIFANGFVDRDGKPVGDTTAGRFRHKVRGEAGREMSRDELAALIAAHTSDQIALVLAAAPTFANQSNKKQSVEEFRRNDSIVHAWLSVVPDPYRAMLVDQAIECGYEGEETSILVDVLTIAQPVPVSIFHEHDGETCRAISLFETWCDEQLRKRASSDQIASPSI